MAVRVDPTLAPAYICLGIIQAGRAELDAAVETFEKAIRIQPDLADGHLGLTQVLESRGEIANAAKQYRQALQIQSNTHVASLKLAWLIATDPSGGLGSKEEAEQMALKVARATKFRSARALDVLAAAHAHAGQFDQAVSIANRALTLAPNDTNRFKQIQKRLQLYENKNPFRRTVE